MGPETGGGPRAASLRFGKGCDATYLLLVQDRTGRALLDDIGRLKSARETMVRAAFGRAFQDIGAVDYTSCAA